MNNMFIVMFGMIISCYILFETSEARLKIGFYNNTCPEAESIVGGFVRDAAEFDPHVPAFLLRLHFHDCFVQGCDGSILIDNGPMSEKLADVHQGLKGFDLIEDTKAQLEFVCPGVVSCADIVAIAARDAVAFSFGPIYKVETGRRDGFVSNKSLTHMMPDFKDSIQLLKHKFFEKGLNVKDLVVLSDLYVNDPRFPTSNPQDIFRKLRQLSGAHTIGTTACFFLMDRLYNFSLGGGPDPSINKTLLPELIDTCPRNGDINFRLSIDHKSGESFDIHILENIRKGFAVLQSDAKLMDDPVTKRIVDSYFMVTNQSVKPSFEADFVKSMVKMGQIGVKTGPKRGEIRRMCNTFN